MPCATIHMFTAGRVLETWRSSPSAAPFDSSSPDLVERFLQGAMGPDLGFCPGVDRFVSELAHYVRTGDLARALFERASTPGQLAYALGWATHVLTDAEIHPLVGRVVGERLSGDRTRRVNASEDEATHTAVEVGLDLHFHRKHPDLPRPPFAPALDPAGAAFLARALRGTYDLRWNVRWLARAQRRAGLAMASWPHVLDVVGAAGGSQGSAALRRWLGRAAVALTTPLARAGTSLAGILRPLSPPGWMVEEVERCGVRFARRFQAHVEGGLARLPNRNLETGDEEALVTDHPGSLRTTRRLALLRSGAAALDFVSRRGYVDPGSA